MLDHSILTMRRTRLNSTHPSSTQDHMGRLTSDQIKMIKTFASGAPSQGHLSQSRLSRPFRGSRVELVRACQEPSLILSLHICDRWKCEAI